MGVVLLAETNGASFQLQHEGDVLRDFGLNLLKVLVFHRCGLMVAIFLFAYFVRNAYLLQILVIFEVSEIVEIIKIVAF